MDMPVPLREGEGHTEGQQGGHPTKGAMNYGDGETNEREWCGVNNDNDKTQRSDNMDKRSMENEGLMSASAASSGSGPPFKTTEGDDGTSMLVEINSNANWTISASSPSVVSDQKATGWGEAGSRIPSVSHSADGDLSLPKDREGGGGGGGGNYPQPLLMPTAAQRRSFDGESDTSLAVLGGVYPISPQRVTNQNRTSSEDITQQSPLDVPSPPRQRGRVQSEEDALLVTSEVSNRDRDDTHDVHVNLLDPQTASRLKAFYTRNAASVRQHEEDRRRMSQGPHLERLHDGWAALCEAESKEDRTTANANNAVSSRGPPAAHNQDMASPPPPSPPAAAAAAAAPSSSTSFAHDFSHPSPAGRPGMRRLSRRQSDIIDQLDLFEPDERISRTEEFANILRQHSNEANEERQN